MKNKLKIKLLYICFILYLLSHISSPLCADEKNLKFERMWPVLQQPWYFKYPQNIALDANGNFYVIDLEIDRIQKFTSDGQFILKWGVRGTRDGEIQSPTSIAVDNYGNIYIADRANYRIQKFTSDGQYVSGWQAYVSGTEEYSGFSGIDVDNSDMIYAVDALNHNIQKYKTDGSFVTKWGSQGVGQGQLDSPIAIASDNNGSVYVIDAGNHRIQKFTSDGTFVLQWGGRGDGNEEFDFGSSDSPSRGGICVDKDGFVYVSDTYNSCIKKFTSQGQFVEKYGIAAWQYTGSEDLVFDHLSGIDVDINGYIYVTDVGNPSVTKFSSDRFVARWGGAGRETGQFDTPSGVALDKDGYVFVSDTNNNRIQKFSSTGKFISSWGKNGGEIGNFRYPGGIVADSNGNIYVTDTGNNRIQKFTSDGNYLAQWGSEGSEPGEMSEPQGIAMDSSGNIYVTDTGNYRVQKFTSDGTYLSGWGTQGSDDGQFEYPTGITVNNDGDVYVADENNDCIHKFTANGVFVTKYSGDFNTDEQMNDPSDVDTDDEGNLYIADKWGTRILVLTSEGELKTVLGAFGTDPGMFSLPVSLAVSKSGDKLYITESPNNRVQIFSMEEPAQTDPSSGTSKAIIVAGGGPYPGNTLWDATQTCTNFAYRVLIYQGYTKDTIYYLSSDSDLDLDGNGKFDDVDMDATNANLKYAVTDWAKDADDLLVYITNHGGSKSFRMSETQLLSASELDSWFDQAEANISGNASLIYDACQSGSFLPEMASTSGNDRILITSAKENESAYFTSQGSLSFSYFFWGNVFNGMSIGDAFISTKNSVQFTYAAQTPLLSADGNSVGNEDNDLTITQDIYIGNGVVSADDIPVIGSISDETTLNGEIQALIFADNVIDANGISSVWAVITPPDSIVDPSVPVLTLPKLELIHTSGSRYEGTYNGFTQKGTYNIALFARDANGTLSIPKTTSFIQKTGSTSTSNDVSISAVINTVEAGDINAVWKKGGEDTTSRGDRVVWGYFYADPDDVTWGSINNPEVFVKVWYDAGGRVDVNFFHVSVPDIEVSASYNNVDLKGTATTTKRYIRHYYNDNDSDGTNENTEDGIPVAGYTPSNNPYSYPTINRLNIGAVINTVEAIGSIDALWTLGGIDTTSRGDQVVWGHFYADPNDVSWGSKNNPELFVKIWFDASGRIDVNYFHVSVPEIEVYSDYVSDEIYDKKGTTIMDDRYIRHEY